MHIVGEKEGDVGSLGNSWVSTLLGSCQKWRLMRTHCCQNKTIGLPLYRQLNFVLPFLAISYRSAIHKLLKMDDLKTLTSLYLLQVQNQNQAPCWIPV